MTKKVATAAIETEFDDFEVDAEDAIMSLEELFATDTTLEANGVWIEVGQSEFHIACAGGANMLYQKAMMDEAMPYRKQLENAEEKPTPKVLALIRMIEMKVYAKAVVLGWKDVMLAGEILPYSVDNCLKLFRAMPRLYDHLRAKATNITVFQVESVKADLKN